MDKEIDRLIDYLVDTRLESRTAFVIVADHGEELWDHVDEGFAERTERTRRWGVDHGHTMYDELVHVPLLIVPPSRGGGSPATLRSPALVSVADVYATVLGFAGAPLPAQAGRAPAGCRRDRPASAARPGGPYRRRARESTSTGGT